jgi:hypothetical protein
MSENIALQKTIARSRCAWACARSETPERSTDARCASMYQTVFSAEGSQIAFNHSFYPARYRGLRPPPHTNEPQRSLR